MRQFTAVVQFQLEGSEGRFEWAGDAANLLLAHQQALSEFATKRAGATVRSILVKSACG